jgi:hypothetical protein
LPVDVAAVAVAVESCASVASLSAGVFGEVASYLPGHRVDGVRMDGDRVEVHVVGRWGVPIPQLADEVRLAAAPLVAGRSVSVVVEDLADPPSHATAEPSHPTEETTP